MKSVMLSIQPKWCELIATGKKTVEVRKTKPKIDTPFKVYIYCTKEHNQFDCLYLHDINHGKWCEPIFGNGKIIGEFECKYISSNFGKINKLIFNLYRETTKSCLSVDEWNNYSKNGLVYCWHISNLVVYDKPKELSDFGLKRPFQSWGYVNELKD